MTAMSRYFSCQSHEWSSLENVALILDKIKEKIGFNKCGIPILTERNDQEGFEEGISAIVLSLIYYITLHTYPKSNLLRVDVWSKESIGKEAIDKALVEILPSNCKIVESKKAVKNESLIHQD